jgi:hypothetical protein
VLGVLEIALIPYAVATRLSVAGVLRVLFINLSSRAPDLDLGTVALKRAIAVIAVVAVISTTATAAGLAPAPPLTLHVAILIFRIFAPIGRVWGLFFRDPTGRWQTSSRN